MLSEEEFLLLWENCKSTNPDLPWDSYDPFTLVNVDEAECKAEFPVEKNDLHRLAEALQIPGTLKCKGAAPENCFGFVDGTVRPISKPGEQQRIVYNGHRRVQQLTETSGRGPNGLIANMESPVGMFLL